MLNLSKDGGHLGFSIKKKVSIILEPNGKCGKLFLENYKSD
jgi:hypothetical protein